MRYNTPMETTSVKKRGPAAIFSLCPGAHIVALVSACVIGLHLLLRHDRALMRRLSAGVIHPVHQRLAALTGRLPFSLAELLYAVLIGTVLVYIISELVRLIRHKGRLRRLYRLLMRVIALALCIYALFCLLWGVYYYGDDFAAMSGLQTRPISMDELEVVTVYFADRLNGYSAQVERDENGLYCADRQGILAKSPTLYRKVVAKYPCLDGPEVRAKGMVFSKIMSLIDFPGFFFPFTAEANVNTDFPVGLFASTVAHELSHQRGVAKEQEANFVAVLSSLENGDVDYAYSACMLAYIHLGNALYSVNPGAYRLIYQGLDETVRADLRANDEYWARYETPVQTVTTTVYEGFLHSYEQTLGMRSYGACVDLLVNYYYDAALEWFDMTPEN